MYTSLKRTIPVVMLISLCSLTLISVNAQTAADNTKVNARDRAKGAVTADQQKENGTDRNMVKRIRQSLMNDKSLSTYAHNVKVVSQGGQVTLKGPVRSEEEKRSVEAKATEIAGVGHVTSEISIAPADSDAPKR
jgi:osmotically-inducible protein OsmY